MPDDHLRPIDADVDLHVPADRGELRGAGRTKVLAAVAVGGALGSLARFGLTTAFPAEEGDFPWAVVIVNVTGSLLIGALMVLVAEVVPARPLLRPFVGVGILGGFTTFSAVVIDAQQAIAGGTPYLALAIMIGPMLLAVPAVWIGMGVSRWVAGTRRVEVTR